MGDGRQVGAQVSANAYAKKFTQVWALFWGVARAKLNFHQPFFWVLERGGKTNSNSESDSDSDSVRWHCLFTPQNFFNKHIRLTGQGSLVLRRMWAWLPFSLLLLLCFSLYLSKTTWLCRLIPSHPFARYFPFASFHFLPLSVVLFSIFPSPPLCFSFYWSMKICLQILSLFVQLVQYLWISCRYFSRPLLSPPFSF